VNQLPKSVVPESRTPCSVGTGGGKPPPVTRWAVSNDRRDATLIEELRSVIEPATLGDPMRPLLWV
jgi:hypothetical protein